MAKKNPVVINDWEEESEVTAVESDVNVTPSAPTRMAPIVQPIAFVPYTTQDQALWQVTPSGYDIPQARRDIANAYASPEEAAAAEAKAAEDSEKKVRFVPIFLAVLSLLIIAVMVVGKFVLQTELALVGGLSGYDYALEVYDIIMEASFDDISALILPASVIIVALASLLNLIANLIKMKSRGACVFAKICIFFMLTFSLVLVLIALMDTIELGYGMYAVAGLSFISLLVGYLARK